MTISITHPFSSGKADGGDATRVRPSNWNAVHTITMATAKLIGRATAGTGAAEEIDCTAAGRQVLAAADIAAIQALLGITASFTTGDIKLTLKTAADTGWVMMNDGTIGNASSGGTTRANADTSALFALIWNNVSDTFAPVSGGRGANAAADFAANKNIALTKTLGRALAASGSGAGLSARTLGQTVGLETHTLSSAEMPSHTHTANVTDPGHTHVVASSVIVNATGGVGAAPSGTTNSGSSTTGISVTNTSTGGGGAHNNMQPSVFLNCMIKL